MPQASINDDASVLLDRYMDSGDPGLILKLQKLLPKISKDQRVAIEQKIKQLNSANPPAGGSNISQQGGNVADDINGTNDTTQTADAAAELAKIETRLKEISGYQFLPPSIKQEKEELNKRKVELSALQHQLENQQLTKAPGEGDGPPFPPPAPDSAPPPKPQPIATKIEVKPAPEPDIKDDVKKDGKGSLIGSNYAVDEGDGGSIEEKIADGDEEKDKKEEATLAPKSEENSFLKEIDFSGKSSDALQKAQKIVDSFKQTLADSDSPDKDYLKRTVDEFADMIESLTEKAKKAGMDEKTKEKAIKGRLAIYIQSIESEFEFSELLDSNLKNQIKELVG